MVDQEASQFTRYNKETGEIPGLIVRGLEITVATIRQPGRTPEELNLIHLVGSLSRQVDRAMKGVPTRSIGQHTPEEIAASLIEREILSKDEIDKIFQDLGYQGFDNYREDEV